MADFGAGELDAFRAEVKAWLEANYPAELRDPKVKSDPEAMWGGRAFAGSNDPQIVWMRKMAQQGWTAFVPWPQSLRAEVELDSGDLSAAAERFEHAFALGCQLGDPCWEGIAGRGLGRIAILRGEPARAISILTDCIARCARLPDAYLWGKGYALETLCGLAVAQALPQASVWVDELEKLAARSGMRELTLRAQLHRAALGDGASSAAATLLAGKIDNPLLERVVAAATQALAARRATAAGGAAATPSSG